MNTILTVKNFHLGYGNEEVLHFETLALEKNTITALLGPSGGGKSSFINAINQQNTSPSYWEEGEFILDGEIVNKKNAKKSIAIISQKARLYTDTIIANFLDGFTFKPTTSENSKKKFAEKVFKAFGVWEYFENILDKLAIQQSMGIHKMLLIAKAMVKSPKLLLLDEVLSNTSIKDEAIIIEMIKELKKFTTVFLITHNKDEARELCDSIALISGGILHEHTTSKLFFKSPQSAIGKEFLESGSAWYLNPNNTKRNKEDNLTALRRFSSICEFYWILPARLGGMQKPGLMTEIEDDLTIMKQLGVNVLVTLQQTPINKVLLEKFGTIGLHFPIVDMDVPVVNKVLGFFTKVKPLIEDNKNIVYHCKAGMGRTGTMLACHLIYLENISAIKAIEKIRYINHKYIQTERQMEFVGEFEMYFNEKKQQLK